MSAAADAATALASLALYRARVLPAVESELRGWERRAEAISASPRRSGSCDREFGTGRR